MVRDPVRWADDPKAGSELRNAMACAASTLAAPSDPTAALERLRERLEEPPGKDGASRALVTKVAFLLLGCALVCGVGATSYYGGSEHAERGGGGPAAENAGGLPVAVAVATSTEALPDSVPSSSASDLPS